MPRLPRLRTVTICFFIGFGLLLAGPLAWFNYSRNSAAALEVAGSLAQSAGDGVALRTRLLMQPFDSLGDTVHRLPEARLRPQGFAHPLAQAFLDVMEEQPQVYSLYFGYGDGGFFQIVSLGGRPKVAASLAAPEGARFAVRSITARGEKRVERWQFLDAERRELSTSADKPSRYDPRTRPWYSAAAQMDGPVRTPLYIFSSTQELGLTVSRRIPGADPAVFGMDLTLESLSRFLADAQVGRRGLIFLFDGAGGLIGHPDPTLLSVQAASKDGVLSFARASMDSLKDPLARAVYARFTAGGGRPLPLQELRLDGRDYLVEVRRMDALGSQDDWLALAVLTDDFTGAVAKTRNQGLFFALGLLVVVLPLLSIAAGRFAERLRLLACEAERIRTLELDPGNFAELPHSKIDEMERLGVAVCSMRSALRTFCRYLPQSLVRQFMASGMDPRPGGERREITLLFTDVENFTPLAEHLIPEELMAAMSEYFEVVGTAILECGGTIDKFIGDAVMAFWNAPFDAEKHVEMACLAALKVSRASEELNRRREAAGLPLLRTRVGLHTGAAVVGNLGSSDRMDYTALGANVNLASRLEGMNKFYATRILASHDVRDRAKQAFLFRSVDVVVPKGAPSPWPCSSWWGACPPARTPRWPRRAPAWASARAGSGPSPSTAPCSGTAP